MDSKSSIHPKSSSFTYSTFTGKTDTIPREISETWPQIIERLSKPAIRANKDGPLWSPATFKPARRKKENVKAVSLLVLDIDGKIYVDLCDETWRTVEITPDTWRIIEAAKAPVLFTRRGGMLALLEPVQGGDLAELREFINCKESQDDDSWALITGWLAMCFHAHGPYPILSVGGEQGSGKSTVSRMLQLLVDPNAGDLRGIPRDERDLMIAANNCRIIREWAHRQDGIFGTDTGGERAIAAPD